MCITQRYVIIAYLLADREQRCLTYSVQAKTQLNTCVKCETAVCFVTVKWKV